MHHRGAEANADPNRAGTTLTANVTHAWRVVYSLFVRSSQPEPWSACLQASLGKPWNPLSPNETDWNSINDLPMSP